MSQKKNKEKYSWFCILNSWFVGIKVKQENQGFSNIWAYFLSIAFTFAVIGGLYFCQSLLKVGLRRGQMITRLYSWNPETLVEIAPLKGNISWPFSSMLQIPLTQVLRVSSRASVFVDNMENVTSQKGRLVELKPAADCFPHSMVHISLVYIRMRAIQEMGVCTILSPIPHQGHLQPLPHILL